MPKTTTPNQYTTVRVKHATKDKIKLIAELEGVNQSAALDSAISFYLGWLQAQTDRKAK